MVFFWCVGKLLFNWHCLLRTHVASDFELYSIAFIFERLTNAGFDRIVWEELTQLKIVFYTKRTRGISIVLLVRYK